MSQESQYYSLVPYGYGQVPFPSQLCELNLHRADEGLDIGSFTDTGNLPTSESPIIQPGSPNFAQPWVQQTNERRQEKITLRSPFRPQVPALSAAEMGLMGIDEHSTQWLAPATDTPIDAEPLVNTPMDAGAPFVKTSSDRLLAEPDANGRIPCQSCSNTYKRAPHLKRHMRTRKGRISRVVKEPEAH